MNLRPPQLYILACLPLLGLPEFTHAQIGVADSSAHADTSKVAVPVSRDSTQAQAITSPPQSTQTQRIEPAQTGLDSSVTYKARKVDVDLQNNVTQFMGDAEVKYKNYTMKAGKITVLWDENLLIAEAMPDTGNGARADGDSLALKGGQPVFSDGGEELSGDRMEFNFKSERGRVIRGRTAFQEGYVGGQTVKRVSPTVINIKDGIYTTCSNEDPHYHFAGKKMKIMMGEEVIAKPVIFFIGKIPLIYLPFALFPSQEDGRQSGIILPQFGSSPQEGRYLQDMGYYWAASEYWDARLTLSFFERTGILLRTHVNYALRYNFTGSLSGSFTRKNFPEGFRERRWNLDVRHSQTIDQNTSLSVNASFVSNNSFYKEFSNNRSQRLNRQLRSNATLSKRWGEGRNSLTLNLSQTKDLDTGREIVTLPQIRFSRNSGAIFPFNKETQTRAGQTPREPSWYNYIRYGYSGFLVNTVNKDTVSSDKDRRVEHDINLSYTNPKKLFGWMSWNLSGKYDEDWFTETQEWSLDSTNVIRSMEKEGFEARRLFRASASASTKLYGTFNTGIGAIKALRHVLTPSVSFSYQPDFSSPFWGYYQTIEDSLGNIQKRDRFRGTPSGEQNSLSFSLNNLFQMKVGEGDKEKKIDLFNLNFNSGYNFAADSLRLSNLSTNFRANPKQDFNVTMSMSHSFYKFDLDTNRVVNQFVFPRLTSINFRAQWTIGGKSSSGAQAADQSGASGQPPATGQAGFAGSPNDPFAPESAFSAFDIPWRASLTFFFSENRFNPTRRTRNAYIDLSNVEVQLTSKWRIGYRVRYNIDESEFADQRLSFYRDLHCWEAQFNWSPSGVSKGYYFRIGIKAAHLQDLKLERRGGTTSVFRPF